MMYRRLLVPLLLTLQMGGCAHVATLGKSPAERVDYWIEHKEYGRALSTIDKVDDKHPDYGKLKARRELLEAVAQRYEKELVAEARQQAAKGQIAQALALLEDGARRLPDSTLLHEELAQMSQTRAKLQEELHLRLLMRRGEWLVAALPADKRLTELQPEDRKAKATLESREKESVAVAKELLTHGVSALQQGRLNEARETLTLSQRLSDSAETREALAVLQKAEQSQVRKVRRTQETARQEKQQARQEQRGQHLDRLLAEYAQSQASHDYLTSLRLMAELEKIAGEEAEIRRMRRELDLAVSVRVTQIMDRASSQYSRGQFQPALNSWREALALDPGNEQIQEHIKRAERVLERLQELREKQTGSGQ